MGSRRRRRRSTSTWTKTEVAASWWDRVARKQCSTSHGRARQRPEAPGLSRVPRRLADWGLRKSPGLLNTEADLACLQSRKKGELGPGGLALQQRFSGLSSNVRGCIFRRVLSFSCTAWRVRTAPLSVCGSQESLLITAHQTTKHRAGQGRDFHCNTSSCLWGQGGRYQGNVLLVTVNEWFCY